MITTLTVNPSFDRTMTLSRLVRGEVHRAEASQVEPGGKGINIARSIAINGGQSCAVFPADSEAQASMVPLLESVGARCDVVARDQPTRTNLSVTELDGTTTKLNEPGPTLQPDVLAALLERTAAGEGEGNWIAAAGSVPPGVSAGVYATLAGKLQRPEASLAIDSSGEALAAMRGIPCALVKPNLEELEALVGEGLPTLGTVVDCAQQLRSEGWSALLVSLGERGALLVDADGVTVGTSLVAKVHNTVGAGDALLAGFLAGGGAGASALAEGLAWAHAAVSSAGTTAPAVSAVDRGAVALLDRIEPNSTVKETA